jgi:hypothetical protein
VLVVPRTGSSEWIVLATARAHDRVAFGGGMLDLSCFEESDSCCLLAGFSDNVSHILVGSHHGCCSRAVTRGLDRRVLDGVNVWSLAGFGWESFEWVRFTGFTDGVLPMGSIPGTAHW